MNVESIEKSLNQTIQRFAIQLEHFIGVAIRTGLEIRSELSEAYNWSPPIQFTDLQKTLLKVLLILLIGTAFFIVYSWRVYGKVITEKFVRPSTLKEIEELKLSVAKLKLPKEHSPRI